MKTIVSVFLFLPVLSVSAEWTRYFGNAINGKAEEVAIRDSWETKEPVVKWSKETGKGFGGAAVAGGRVYILDRELGVADVMRCLDLESGKEVWKTRYEAPGKLPFAGSRSVPTVTAKHVFTSGGFGQASCFAREGGELLWQHDLVKGFGGEIPRFGYSTNPVVSGDSVIYAVLGKDIGLVAFDQTSGEVKWKTPGLYLSTSSPAVFTIAGREQLLFLSSSTSGTLDTDGEFLLNSFDPATGKLLWRYDSYKLNNPIPVPVKVDDTHIMVTGGYEAGSQLLEVKADGSGGFSVKLVVGTNRGSQIHPPVIVGGHAYFIANENANLKTKKQRRGGGLVCMGLDGIEKWHTGEEPNFGRGGLVYSGGKLVVHDGHTGRVHLVRATPEKFTPLGETNPFGITRSTDQQMWAPPALSGGFLLVRSQDELKCLDLR